ncbi:replication initiation protein [Campylobacter sp. RM12640]|uniref:replication initiation protein n=1 Tax=Campylobacter TaxID=194 RepID=UPI001EFBDEFA|nr:MULTISPECIES: replication initiation protein [Campylobacter]MBZ7982826.1 replication initiation protein [Campylobacter sp. RM12640]MBZ7990116.1 replication initiation protein [Campylobacter sp. RM12635]MCR8700347.1 replication initiation protein [Campylobacter ureolyticus]ULO04602.1 replication initiation protein [Campylobacter sp. RM12651]
MGQELVKYHNDFNKIKIPSFTAQEQNILMGIISKIRDLQSDNIITFYPNELKEFSTQNYTNDEILSIVRILRDKFFKADFTIIKEYKNAIAEEIFNLFSKFTIYKHIETLEIERVELSVNNEFSYLLNDLLGNFTSFQLSEFMALKSKYSKSLYRLLKQYKHTGKCLIYKNDWQGFCDFISIPKDYNQSKIDEKILKPAILELGGETNLFNTKEPIFPNLTFTKIKDKKGRGRGGKVVGIEFYFTAQQEVKQEQKQATTTQQNATQSNENKVNNIINDLANKAKDFNKPAQKKEPQMLEQRLGFGGRIVTDLDAYVDLHFKSFNEMYKTDDTCKIKTLKQNDDCTISMTALNQYTNKNFYLNFENFENFKNWFNKYRL